MSKLIAVTMVLLVTLFSGAGQAASTSIANTPESTFNQTIATETFVLGPPSDTGPTVVQARFEFHDINEINDAAETFEFSGVLSLKWHDPRQAFDPAVAGVGEKVFQGGFQFDEISPGWYPQVVLVNESGLYQSNGVVLRIQPDGTSTLVSMLNATAESEFDMRRFPFDAHRIEAVFEVLGFDRNEVQLQVTSNPDSYSNKKVQISQWAITAISESVRDRAASYAGREGVASAFVVSVDVKRNSFYTIRLVVLPLIIIVTLSFSVFWMDRSSLGDRIAVSFIGILTAVAFHSVINEHLPHISYYTLIHGFLNLSFLTMCSTVVINLTVGALDKGGKCELGDRIDYQCRWAFPLVYFGLMLVMVGVAILLY